MKAFSERERTNCFERAFISVLPAVTSALLKDNKIHVAPPDSEQKAWDNYREIGDLVANFGSFVATRATLEWEMKCEWR